MTENQKQLEIIRKNAMIAKNKKMDRKVRKQYKDRQEVKHEVYNW